MRLRFTYTLHIERQPMLMLLCLMLAAIDYFTIIFAIRHMPRFVFDTTCRLSPLLPCRRHAMHHNETTDRIFISLFLPVITLSLMLLRQHADAAIVHTHADDAADIHCYFQLLR